MVLWALSICTRLFYPDLNFKMAALACEWLSHFILCGKEYLVDVTLQIQQGVLGNIESPFLFGDLWLLTLGALAYLPVF